MRLLNYGGMNPAIDWIFVDGAEHFADRFADTAHGFSMGFFPTPSFWKLWDWATWISLLMWDFFSTTSPSQQDSSYSTLHLPLKIDITTPEKSDGKKLEDEKTIGSASLLKWFSIKKLAVEDVESPELMGWLVGWKVVVFFSSSL